MSFFSQSPLGAATGASWGDDEDDERPISTEARTPFADEQDEPYAPGSGSVHQPPAPPGSGGAGGLGSSGTDRLVELVKASNTDGCGPLFGAKITGGGSGGTVCVLGRDSAESEAAIRAVVKEYAEATGHNPVVFAGSSQGAVHFGVLEVLV